MRDLKTYLSVAPVLSTLWFGSLVGLLIEINRLFPNALTRFLAKGKDVRVRVILECTDCVRNGVNKELAGISSRLELRKFCPYCSKHTIHGEIKK
ncbi:hypothetical protein Pint_21007 [Pistacia integerrima]|uniref:Uncharacterized protein n=1 Tax=Pistacia integerrima TaxID=434235 RepID=A0ACC0XCM7_9ROSI|nr:hypothetical protein Pint_21007 [Pistacia integerrima]